MIRFNGVATKYLQYYLNWYTLLNRLKYSKSQIFEALHILLKDERTWYQFKAVVFLIWILEHNVSKKGKRNSWILIFYFPSNMSTNINIIDIRVKRMGFASRLNANPWEISLDSHAKALEILINLLAI
jgi:hypothetical protein